MVFSSAVFLFVFLPITYLINWICPKITAKNIALTIASLIFYAYGEPFAVLLMIGSIICNYIMGRFMTNERLKKPVLVFSIIFNVAVLVIFKYLTFLVTLLNDITGLMMPVPQIALPIGISFFTFQAMSYVIDVYKNPELEERNLLNVFLYISFFPQLIAGPIIRFEDVARQIKKRFITLDKTFYGVRRFIFGLAKKVLIANTMGEIADMAFAIKGSELTLPVAWAGALCYVLQIYFDFSGYSDMAIGLGKIFGFDFKENFNYPFSAGSIQDFWHRWNISVSTWFKEYVYIPLGGNRKGRMRTNINRIIVFFLTGLWHGANLTFVVWGLVHGFFLLMEGNNIIPVKKAKNAVLKAVCHIYTMLVVVLTFVIFRADTLTDAVNFIGKMFAGGLSAGAVAEVIGAFSPYVILIFVLGCIFSVPLIPKIRAWLEEKGKSGISVSASAVVSLGLLAMCVMRLASSTYNPFIYFRF